MKTAAKAIGKEKIILIGILFLAGILTYWGFWDMGYGNEYYTAAVKSMLQSPHNFFFVSFDPTGFISVDKPALGLWIQCLFAAVFGVHGWSVILPEALCSVGSVAVLYAIIKRNFGPAAGLFSALLLALTPIFVAAARTNNLDPSLALVCLLAVWALDIAAERGSLKYLLLSMALVGIGFNIKMLEAYLIVPALFLTYLITARTGVRKRILHLIPAAAVLLAVSLSWAAAVDLTPADERPYVGSSNTNSVLELALYYNGIERVVSLIRSGGSSQHIGTADTGTLSEGSDGGRVAQEGASFTPGESGQPAGTGYDDSLSGGYDDGRRTDVGRAYYAPDGYGQGAEDYGDFLPGGGSANAIPEGFGGGGDGIGQVPRQENGILGGVNPFGTAGGAVSEGTYIGTSGEAGKEGFLRFFNSSMSGQITWFLPLALFGIGMLVLSLVRSKDALRRTALRQLVLWSIIFITMYGYFSVGSFFHLYYLSLFAPCIAALGGIGLWEIRRRLLAAPEFRSRDLALLFIALGATAATEVLILSYHMDWFWIFVPILCGAIGTGVLLLTVFRRSVRWRRASRRAASALIAAGILAAPAFWSLTPILYGTSSVLPSAGPSAYRLGSSISAMAEELNAYLENKYNGETYYLAVTSAADAEPVILGSDLPVMTTGGFRGTDEAITLEEFQALVAKGEIRYFWLRNSIGRNEIAQWAQTVGSRVSLTGTGLGSGTLYDLSEYTG